MQFSQNLCISDDYIHCKHCNHRFTSSSENWKSRANLDELPLRELGTPYTTGENVILRKFSCPGCGVLLDSEIAMPDDPFLEDILLGNESPAP